MLQYTIMYIILILFSALFEFMLVYIQSKYY